MTDSPELHAARLRLRAAMHECAAVQLRLLAAGVITTEAVRKLGAAIQSSYDQELGDHPDLMELDVALDGFYEPPS